MFRFPSKGYIPTISLMCFVQSPALSIVLGILISHMIWRLMPRRPLPAFSPLLSDTSSPTTYKAYSFYDSPFSFSFYNTSIFFKLVIVVFGTFPSSSLRCISSVRPPSLNGLAPPGNTAPQLAARSSHAAAARGMSHAALFFNKRKRACSSRPRCP